MIDVMGLVAPSPGAARSQALIVDQARRARAARAIAAVFVVLSALAVVTLTFFVPSPMSVVTVLAVSTAAYVVVWRLARDSARSSQAGAAIVATHLTVVV